MAKARRRAHQPTFYARSPGVAAPMTSERGLVWVQRPDGIFNASGTGGTFWLQPTPSGSYQTTWMGAGGDQRDLGVHPYASAVQVAARFDPASGRRQAAENPIGGSLLDPDFAERYRRGVSGAHENPVIRYSDQDILRLLRDTNRPAWERTAHITAAARQRGYSGDEKNQERMVRFLEASLEGVVPEGPGYEDALLRHARENPRSGPLHVEVVELPKWGSDRSKWAVKVNGKTVGSYWNKEHADKKAESLRSGAAENPLDTSIDGWVHWHGDPPNEVGNLGPGQQVQTTDGWWYRQDTGADAGKLYFKAADPNGPVVELEPEVVEIESIPYVEPVEAPLTSEDLSAVHGMVERMESIEELPLPVDYVGLASELPPPGELPIGALAVENPRGERKSAWAYDFLRWSPGWWIENDMPDGWLVVYRMSRVRDEPRGEVVALLRQESRIWHAFKLDGTVGHATTPRSAIEAGSPLRDVCITDAQVRVYCRKLLSAPPALAGRFQSLAQAQSQCTTGVSENPRRRGADATAWRHTPEGEDKYRAARAEAQQKANTFGYDFGIEANDVFKSYMVMMLPRAENRSGYELRVEVVHPEDLSKTHRGHGPTSSGRIRENPTFQRGERLRIRSKGPQGQPFESFWFTVPSPMTPEEVALQFAQTGQPGMLIEIVSGKPGGGVKWTYQQGRLGGQPTVTRVRGQ